MDDELTPEPPAIDVEGGPDAFVAKLRTAVAADRRALADPAVKDWCGRRWRDLFLSNAEADPEAVDAAAKRLKLPGTDLSMKRGRDERSRRRRLAERFFHPDHHDEWRQEMAPPPPVTIGEGRSSSARA